MLLCSSVTDKRILAESRSEPGHRANLTNNPCDAVTDTQSRRHKPPPKEKKRLGTRKRKCRSEHLMTKPSHCGATRWQATRPRATRLLKQAHKRSRHGDESSLTSRVSDIPVRSERGSIELDSIHVCAADPREKHCSCTDPLTHRSHRWTVHYLPAQLRVLLQPG